MSLTTEQLIDQLGVLGTDLLAELKRLNARLDVLAQERGQAGASSVEIKTSTRGADVSVKAYADSPIGPVGDAALAEYARVVSEVNQRVVDAMNGGKP